MGDARIDAAAKALKRHDEDVPAHAASVIANGWYESMAEHALAAADAVSASECDALRDELGIAQERGDGWRSIVKEDTIELERLRGAASECEKLKAALRACVEVLHEWSLLYYEAPPSSLTIETKIVEARARALVGPTPPGISDRDRKLGQAIAMLRFGSEEEFNESFAAARALVGSVPQTPNEADE